MCCQAFAKRLPCPSHYVSRSAFVCALSILSPPSLPVCSSFDQRESLFMALLKLLSMKRPFLSHLVGQSSSWVSLSKAWQVACHYAEGHTWSWSMHLLPRARKVTDGVELFCYLIWQNSRPMEASSRRTSRAGAHLQSPGAARAPQ